MPFKDPEMRIAYEKARYNTPERLEQRKKWQNSEKCRVVNRRYDKTSHGALKRRDYQLFLRGSSLEKYNDLFVNQNGSCAICGIHQSKTRRALDQDHNHVTKKARGLLCDRHNRAVGMFNDSPELLRKAAEYLEKYL